MASRLKALQDQQAALQTEARALLSAADKNDNKRMTAEQKTRFEAIKTERSEVEAELKMELDAQEWERTKAPVVPNGNEDTKQQADDRKGVEEPKAADKFGSFGEMLQAVANAAKPHGHRDQRLMAGPTGLNESVGSDGGFLVGTDRASTLLERTYAVGDLLGRVSKIPISANSNGITLPAIDETSRANGSRFGGILSYWTAEAGLKTPSQPKFREMKLRLNKIAALVYTTDELMADAAALQAWVERQLPQELKFRVEDSIINGTGAGMPLGFLNSGATITVAKDAGQAAATISYTNIINMWARLYAPSRANAIWLVDPSAEAALYTMSLQVGAGGAPVFLPAGGASAAPFSTLFGRPIVVHEYGAALGSVGDIMLVDPTQYLLIDKGDVQSAVSMHVRFLYDESVFRFVYRVDGQPEWNAPLTPKSGSSTTSPFVALAAR
jgi:HK97 family phage major capsid protein